MRRRFGSEVVSLLVLVLCLAVSFPSGSALAQDFVSDNGGFALAAEVGAMASPPGRGTGELVEGGTLQIPAEHLNVPSLDEALGLQGESIIGADSRVRVTVTTSYPNRAIAYLYVVFPNNKAGSCTGWFFGKRAVATAGHCVYSSADGGWAKTLYVYPGRNGTLMPYGYTTKLTLYTHPRWATLSDHSYDWGIIRTSVAKGSTVGWFGYRWQPSNTFPGPFTVRGYPGDKVGALARTMWTMSGPVFASSVTGVHSRKLWYQMDTFGGQSGSPIYQIYNNACCYGVGIHAYGIGFPSNSFNSGTRITQALFNQMVAVKNLDP